MTKIIGHRGAAGLALENSRESLQAALRLKLDAIEFDVHLTKDNHIVVIHDADTSRIANEHVLVKEQTLAELQALPLRNGQHILTLDEVLTIVRGTNVIIDIKDKDVVSHIAPVLKQHPDVTASFASFTHSELQAIRAIHPKAPIYVLDHYKPLQIIKHARALNATGIGLNKWLMNPLTYYLAKQYGLEMYVYTVNNRFIGYLLRKVYPKVGICTDHPERFLTHQSV